MMLTSLRRLAMVAAFVATPAIAQNLAIVNGKPITKSQADMLIKQLVSQGQKDTPELQKAVREELINRMLLLEEANKQGIANRPEVKEQAALAEQTVVLRTLIEDFIKKNKPTPAELKARYDALSKDSGGKELHLHHILVDNEKQAKDLTAKLKTNPKKFEEFAKQYSKDPGSGKNGGDLDFANPNAYVPEFAEAAKKLKTKGQITEAPVKTQFGWHIIRYDDSRDSTPPSLDQVKPQIEQQVVQEKLKAYEQNLRKAAKIE